MTRCHSCVAEHGEYHLPSCESRDRDIAGRFVLGADPAWWSDVRLAERIVDLEAALHGGGDDEGDERSEARARRST